MLFYQMFSKIYDYLQKAFDPPFYWLLSFFRTYAPAWVYLFVVRILFPSRQSVCDAFNKASSFGHMRAMQFLHSLAYDFDMQQMMFTSNRYEAFCLAAQNGHHDAMVLIHSEVSQILHPKKMLLDVMIDYKRWVPA